MTRVAVFSEQPLLIAGLQAVTGSPNAVVVTGAFSGVQSLIEHLAEVQPDVALVELTSAMNIALVEELTSHSGGASVVLWADTIPVEFASQALAVGVRGFLRKSLSVDMQLRCIEKVACGELWVEQPLSSQLLSSKRTVLTPRERLLVTLLAQGLKNKELATSMNLTEGTVKVYLSRLFDKTGAKDRFDLALYAWKNFYYSRPDFEMGNKREGSEPANTGLSMRTLVTHRAAVAA